LVLILLGAAYAQGTAFTYQGRLTDSDNPADGVFDMQFKLFDTATVGTGSQQGATLTNSSVQVTNGTFSVELDFGAGVFNGSARFLEISIRPAGSVDPYTVLSPRQALTSAPYAIRSNVAVSADALSGACVSCITSGQIQSVAGGAVTGAIPVASVPAGSASYIQNTATEQAGANFNISGDGAVGGRLSASIVNALTRYDIGGLRMLAASGPFSSATINLSASNTFVGESAGLNTAPAAALTSSTGKLNSFFGADAGKANITGASNSFFGVGAGRFNTSGTSNAFFGREAGASNINTSFNAFFGSSAGRANTASNNSFFGAEAGVDNTTGSENAFFGRAAGAANTTGSGNSFFGSGAGVTNSTAVGNSFFGSSAGVLSTGVGNSFFGERSGADNRTGFDNAFFGRSAGELNTFGDGNSFFGTNAGDSNQTGNNNTIIGYLADTGTGGLANATAIGARALVGQSNALVLGSINGVNGATATVSVGIGTTTPSDRLHVTGDIRVGTGTTGCVKDADGTVLTGSCSSDARLKQAITPFPATLDKLIKLRPVHFLWRAKQYPERAFGDRQSYGLIAQEVEEVMPELVTDDEHGYKVVNYSKLPLMSVQAIKELKSENDKLKKLLRRQQAEIESLKKVVCQIRPDASVCR
ncbi:MAG TPA: tail fiber domain-containing protein, partial [Blastocatellia bacterium]|nr:tail fiber domain-containing protein [Blastocatellia bacterium]